MRHLEQELRMATYQIFVGDDRLREVKATSPEAALEEWCRLEGWDCVEHAAKEYNVSPVDITAVLWQLDDPNEGENEIIRSLYEEYGYRREG